MNFEYLKMDLLHYAVIAGVLLFFGSIVSNYVAPYLGFLDFLGSISVYVKNFIIYFALLVVTDKLLHKFLRLR